MHETIRAAHALAQHDRAAGIAALNELFRAGHPPTTALNGRYHGGLAALDIRHGITELAEHITNMWLPWQGKRFDAASQTGDNIFTRDSFVRRICSGPPIITSGRTPRTPIAHLPFARLPRRACSTRIAMCSNWITTRLRIRAGMCAGCWTSWSKSRRVPILARRICTCITGAGKLWRISPWTRNLSFRAQREISFRRDVTRFLAALEMTCPI